MPIKAYQSKIFCLTLALLISFLFCSLLQADVIWRKNGTKVEGKILKEEKNRVKIEVKVGSSKASIWINRDEIDSIDRGLSKSEEFEQRLEKLDAADVDGHKKLRLWAKKNRLKDKISIIEKRMPAVEHAAFIKSHPLNYCRTCQAVGTVKCSECKGKKHIEIACQHCKGEGEFKCRTCGHLDTPGQLRCRRCTGAGKYEKFNPAKGRKEKVRCPDCKGKGNHKCKVCKGKAIQKCLGCKGSKHTKKECKACKEQKEDAKCPTCKGKKLQPKALTPEEYAAEQKKLAEEAAKGEKTEKEKADEKPSGSSKPKSKAKT